ncbi:MAG: sigma-70 family RNA polymerase sigma factor [Planctomycetota bacterium]|nr:MAG: sigma-70 family RNA polymerase sigma factor [Planctomycetota bacterium]
MLNDVRSGVREASDRLLTAVYDELRRLAAQRLRHERPGQTLQATALVHEAYLRLLGDSSEPWENRRHFFAAAAEAMRRILIEAARRKARVRHGGGRRRKDLDEADRIELPVSVDLLALDEALERLAQEDPDKARLVELRFFAGLSVADAGEVLGVSRATADRYWAFAKAWLYHELRKGDSTSSTSLES